MAQESVISGHADTVADAQTLEDLADGLVHCFDAEDGSPTFGCLVQSVKFDLTAENYSEWPYTIMIAQRSKGTAPRFDVKYFNPNYFNA